MSKVLGYCLNGGIVTSISSLTEILLDNIQGICWLPCSIFLSNPYWGLIWSIVEKGLLEHEWHLFVCEENFIEISFKTIVLLKFCQGWGLNGWNHSLKWYYLTYGCLLRKIWTYTHWFCLLRNDEEKWAFRAIADNDLGVKINSEVNKFKFSNTSSALYWGHLNEYEYCNWIKEEKKHEWMQRCWNLRTLGEKRIANNNFIFKESRRCDSMVVHVLSPTLSLMWICI